MATDKTEVNDLVNLNDVNTSIADVSLLDDATLKPIDRTRGRETEKAKQRKGNRRKNRGTETEGRKQRERCLWHDHILQCRSVGERQCAYLSASLCVAPAVRVCCSSSAVAQAARSSLVR